MAACKRLVVVVAAMACLCLASELGDPRISSERGTWSLALRDRRKDLQVYSVTHPEALRPRLKIVGGPRNLVAYNTPWPVGVPGRSPYVVLCVNCYSANDILAIVIAADVAILTAETSPAMIVGVVPYFEAEQLSAFCADCGKLPSRGGVMWLRFNSTGHFKGAIEGTDAATIVKWAGRQ